MKDKQLFETNAPDFLAGSSRRENTLRNVLFLVVVLVAAGVIALPRLGGWRDSLPLTLVEEFAAVAEEENQVGGDLAPEPAPPMLRPVQVTTTTLDTAAMSAAALLVRDKETGEVIVEKDGYIVRPLASITKLMSAMILSDLITDFSATTTIPEDSIQDTFLQPGFTYTVEDVWNAALIGSSNRAILTLIAVAGLDEAAFVGRMNERARTLGLTETVFTDPTGLDAGNRANAAEVSSLFAEALAYENIRTTLEKDEYRLATVDRKHAREFYNTNWLLLGWIPHRFSQLGPGKTGYIPAAGYNFVTEVSTEEGHTLQVVVLGASSHEARFSEARDLANWVFANVRWQLVP